MKLLVFILIVIALLQGPKKEIGCVLWALIIICAVYLFRLI